MTLRVVRLGTARAKGEGPRLGTVRRPPRGVKKADYARLDYYDAWLPELSPSPALVKYALAEEPMGAARWKAFAARYRREMATPQNQRLLEMLALLSRDANLSVGCYCERADRCHRSVLAELLREHGARVFGP